MEKFLEVEPQRHFKELKELEPLGWDPGGKETQTVVLGGGRDEKGGGAALRGEGGGREEERMEGSHFRR